MSAYERSIANNGGKFTPFIEENDMQRDDIYKLHSTTLETVMVSVEKELHILSDGWSGDTYALEHFLDTLRDAQVFAIERETGA